MKSITGLLLSTLLLLTYSSIGQQREELAPEASAAQVEAIKDGISGSFREVPNLKEGFWDVSPVQKKDGLLVGELGVDGGNKEMILNLAQEISDTLHGNFDSFLISHKGKLVFESYYLKGRINLPHPQASSTKAFTSFLLGRAMQLGYLSMADLDKPLIGFLKELDPSKFTSGAEKITLHKALTMSGGLSLTDEQRKGFEDNPGTLKGQGEVQTLLEQSAPITDASQQFLYGNYNTSMVMQVIDAVVPGRAKDFIQNEFLGKLGITDYGWSINGGTGMPESGWRTSFTSRDMVKIGQLVLNEGKWNGEQLIPEAYINKATNRVVLDSDDENFEDNGNVSNTGYGYFWWQSDMQVGDRRFFTTSARGGGGQYIIVINELDMIVVITAHTQDDRTLQFIAERVLPAFLDPK